MNRLLQDQAVSGSQNAGSERAHLARSDAWPISDNELDIASDSELPVEAAGFDLTQADQICGRQPETGDGVHTRTIVIVEERALVRESLAIVLQSALLGNVEPFAHVTEALRSNGRSLASPASLVLLSAAEQCEEAVAREVALISAEMPGVPTIVIGKRDDLETALGALNAGAKGYLTANMSLHVALEAMKFVIGGGTYVPAEWVLAAKRPVRHAIASGELSDRERAVIVRLRQGKSNKVIAYELNMCEGTVKVHVRNIMKKLRARNRTEVAIKSEAIFAQTGEEPPQEGGAGLSERQFHLRAATHLGA
jgi:DNA-binding NarL/FixJ family response regulator